MSAQQETMILECMRDMGISAEFEASTISPGSRSVQFVHMGSTLYLLIHQDKYLEIMSGLAMVNMSTAAPLYRELLSKNAVMVDGHFALLEGVNQIVMKRFEHLDELDMVRLKRILDSAAVFAIGHQDLVAKFQLTD